MPVDNNVPAPPNHFPPPGPNSNITSRPKRSDEQVKDIFVGDLEGTVYGSTGIVNSVANSDGTLTISPTAGSVVASIALSHANVWSGVQTLELPLIADVTDSTKQIAFSLAGSTTAAVLTLSSAQTGSHSLTIPVLGGPDTLMTLGTAQTIVGAKTFTNSDILLLGSSTGATTFASANSSATNYTITYPALTGTVTVAGSTTTNYSYASALTTTTTANYVMGGFSVAGNGNSTFTPSKYGNLLVTFNGQCYNGTTGDGINIKLAYNTSVATAGGSISDWTVVGALIGFTDVTGLTTQGVPFSMTRVITGLSPGTQYFLDFQFEAVTGGTAGVSNMNMVIQEIPY